MSKVHLKFLLCSRRSEQLTFRVLEQRESTRSCRYTLFCVHGIPGHTDITFRVDSYSYPELNFMGREVYLRGEYLERDNAGSTTYVEDIPTDLAIDVCLIVLKAWSEVKAEHPDRDYHAPCEVCIRYYKPERSPDHIYEF